MPKPIDMDIPVRPLPKAAPWERYALPAALLAVVLFLVPALAGWAPMFHETNSVEGTPRLIAIARQVQRGHWPLWDSNTFAGALPHYANDTDPIFYVPLAPFLLAADVDNVNQSFWVLFVLPFCLHVLWATLGGYLFARRAVALRPAAAALAALLYALGPEMATSTVDAPQVWVCSYLPWVMLATWKFIETRRASWWLAGVLLAALMASTGQISYLSRNFFYVAATSLLAAGFSFRGDRRVLWGLLGAVAMGLTAAALTGPVWAGAFEGTAWYNEVFGIAKTLENVEGFFPPSALVCLFIPDFLGIFDSTHGWGLGAAEGMNSWFFLTGGMCVTFAAAVAVAFLFLPRPGADRDPADRRLRLWTWVSLIMLLFSLTVMLGYNTPLFRPLAFLMPWLKLPRPIYYRTAETWFLGILAAIGVCRLLALPEGRPRRALMAILAGTVLLAVLTAAVALLATVSFRGRSVPAWQTLTQLGQWDWFLTHPVLYWVLACLLLTAGAVLGRGRRLGWLVPAGIAVEVFLFASAFVYQAGWGPRDADEKTINALVIKRRYHRITDHPYYLNLPSLRPFAAPRGPRFVGRSPDVDNLAWVTGGHALLGYDAKPLMPRMARALAPFTKLDPYSLVLSVDDVDPALPPEQSQQHKRRRFETMLRFLSNMNVACMVGFTPPPTPETAPPLGPDFLTPSPLANPVPWAFLQNQVVAADAEAQRQALYNDDLRRAVFVEPSLLPRLHDLPPAGPPPAPAQVLARFQAFQRENPILRLDRSDANRTSLQVEVSSPAMLVINECFHPGWSASVDGKSVPLWQVNYLQQGLRLTPGRHDVQLRFFPPSLAYGLTATGCALVILAAVAAVTWWLARRRRSSA